MSESLTESSHILECPLANTILGKLMIVLDNNSFLLDRKKQGLDLSNPQKKQLKRVGEFQRLWAYMAIDLRKASRECTGPIQRTDVYGEMTLRCPMSERFAEAYHELDTRMVVINQQNTLRMIHGE